MCRAHPGRRGVVVGEPALEAESEVSSPRSVVAVAPLAQTPKIAPQMTLASSPSSAPSEPRHLSSHVRAELETLKVEVEKLLAELG